MGLFSKKKEETKAKTKQDVIKEILKKEAQKSPSERFVSGAVFDISRKFRPSIMDALHENNAVALLKWFVFAYSVFLSKPETVGLNPTFVNAERDDTNPADWNADIVKLDNNGDCAALLFMPVQNKEFSAGVVGIIIGECGDGYYYCMLNTDENKVSEVFRNKASQGIHKVGEVSGLGFELMNSFVECIKNDYLSKETDSKEQGEGEPEAVYFLEHKAAPKAFYLNPMGFFDILSEKDGFYKMMKKSFPEEDLAIPLKEKMLKRMLSE